MSAMHQHQMSRHSSAGANRVGLCRVEALAADEAQGGRHVPSVGGSVLHNGSARLIDVTSLNSRGRIAICATRPSQFHIASRLPPSGRGDRRADFSLKRLARRKFMCCALVGRSHQLNRISDKPGSDLAYPFHRVLSKSVGLNANRHSERRLTHEQEHVASGARSV